MKFEGADFGCRCGGTQGLAGQGFSHDAAAEALRGPSVVCGFSSGGHEGDTMSQAQKVICPKCEGAGTWEGVAGRQIRCAFCQGTGINPALEAEVDRLRKRVAEMEALLAHSKSDHFSGVSEYIDAVKRRDARIDELEARVKELEGEVEAGREFAQFYRSAYETADTAMGLTEDGALRRIAGLEAENAKLKARVHGYEHEPREPGCQCHLEVGDSPCRVHDRARRETAETDDD